MRRSILVSLAMPLFALVIPSASNARADESMVCSNLFVMTLSPGATTTPQDFAFTTAGQTGTIFCQGGPRGRQVTGPGTIGVEGTVRGTCFEGKGTGTNRFTVPTAGGPMEIVDPFTVSYRGAVGSYEGTTDLSISGQSPPALVRRVPVPGAQQGAGIFEGGAGAPPRGEAIVVSAHGHADGPLVDHT